MEVHTKSAQLLLILGFILLTAALQGVQGEVEQEGPSESECRPYIEKALKELEAAEDTRDQRDVSPDDESSDQEKEDAESKEDRGASDEGGEVEAAPVVTSQPERLSVFQKIKRYFTQAVQPPKQQEKREEEKEKESDEAIEADEKPTSLEDESEGKEEEQEAEEQIEEREESEEKEEGETEEDEHEEEEGSEGVAEGSDEGIEGSEDTAQEEEMSREEVEQAETQQETEPESEAEEKATSVEETESMEPQTLEVEEVESTEQEAEGEVESVEAAESAEHDEVKSEEGQEDAQEEESREPQEVESREAQEVESREEQEQGSEDDVIESKEEVQVSVEEAEGESVEQQEGKQEEEEIVQADEAESKESEEHADETKDDEPESKGEGEEAVAGESHEADEEKAESVEDIDDLADEEDVVPVEPKFDSEDVEEEEAKSKEEEKSDEERTSDKTEEEAVEDLTMDVEVPSELRPRDHVEQLLKLDDHSSETEEVINHISEITLRELKKLYENAIKPLEVLYKYRDLSNRHFGDADIFSKPLVLFMGPWSGGKSSIINYLLNNEYNETSLRTGAEPSPAYFNILMYGEEPEILDGTELAADYTFSGLQKFGQGLEERLRGVKLPTKLLEKINIVEIPGILEVRKQVSRLFPFNDACQWFIDRADLIFLVYDPSKLDVGPETEAILDQLKGREHQTRIILNKADQVKPEELMRVQGSLIWNISPLMSSPQPPVMYTVSLWSRPYETGAPTKLLQAQERAFLRDLRGAVDKRIENKIASARRFAVRVRNHAKMVDCYLTTYHNHKSLFGNRKQVAEEIIEHPQNYHIYEGLSTLTNISRYDLPDPDVYRDFFKLNPLYEFQQLSATCTYFRGCPINRLDVAIAYDLPDLVGSHKKLVENALSKASNDSTIGS